jgi:hypothetical protein
MKMKIIVCALLLVVSAGLVTSFSVPKNTTFDIYPAPPNVPLATVDWSRYYTSISQVIADSDAIVIGEVTSSVVFSKPNPTAPNHTSSFVHTDHTFKIEAVYKGKVLAGSIIIEQYGDSKSYISDSPQLPIGKTVILCLYEYAPGEYNIVGGPQGRFHVVDGKVFSLGEVYEPSAETCKNVLAKGISLDSFLKLIT